MYNCAILYTIVKKSSRLNCICDDLCERGGIDVTGDLPASPPAHLRPPWGDPLYWSWSRGGRGRLFPPPPSSSPPPSGISPLGRECSRITGQHTLHASHHLFNLKMEVGGGGVCFHISSMQNLGCFENGSRTKQQVKRFRKLGFLINPFYELEKPIKFRCGLRLAQNQAPCPSKSQKVRFFCAVCVHIGFRHGFFLTVLPTVQSILYRHRSA